MSLPPKLLDLVAGRSLGGRVPDRLMLLVGSELEVLVYASDVSITGTKSATARARAAIATALVDAPAYLTTSAEAQRIEDAIAEVAGDRHDRDPASVRARVARLRLLDPRIAQLMVPFEEWETVYRERLEVERDLLAGIDDVEAALGAPSERDAPVVDRVVALGTAALIAADAALLAANLTRSRLRR